MHPSVDEPYWDADVIFQQDLALAHTSNSTSACFNDRSITVLDRPAQWPELNPVEDLWWIVERKIRDTAAQNADELKSASKATWASWTPLQSCVFVTFITLHWRSNSCKMSPKQLVRANIVQYLDCFSEGCYFCFKNPIFVFSDFPIL